MRAVLGPTNTGKTHLAVERMLAYGTGMIGLPLRLLAREVYDRMVKQKGADACALITGEERIRPEGARYFACTVEAMPVSEKVDFLAVDEIQLAQDPDRGHVFTTRILHARGIHETMLLGADTMRPALQALDLDIDPERRERFSKLSYAGPIKITKLPKRSAVVAFSAEEVYAIAELLKRQRGGCAVIMGALSPRTRNAQVELYQSGEVDYIVATDAIGMGLNLDVGHIAFASRRKFDGRQRRPLRPDELAQIAGRAGRFRDDGTFGETADCEPFDEDSVARIEQHHFEPVDFLNWRNAALNWESLDGLLASLRRNSPHVMLRRAPEALDETTLAALAQDEDVKRLARLPAHVRRLWDLCTLPDFRKSGPDAHLKLVGSLVEKIAEPSARLKDEWVHEHVERLDRVEGDIDMLQQRLADIRTWTYAANRSDWMENAHTWRLRTRDIEDRLSDALHERLMHRFVDRRTSALLRTLNAEDDSPAEIDAEGAVRVGGHVVGRLDGLRFEPDNQGRTLEGRALRNAAQKSLRPIIEQRLISIANAEDGALEFDAASLRIRHGDAQTGWPAARLVPGNDWLNPGVELIGANEAPTQLREAARERAARWLADHLRKRLDALFQLRGAINAGGLVGAARGAAWQLSESGASLDRRAKPGETAFELTQEDRAQLKSAGVRSGRVSLWLPDIAKPAAAGLVLALRAVQRGEASRAPPMQASFALAGTDWPEALLNTAGYLRLGPRAVRADMAERLLWQLSEIRRASPTSTFAAPVNLAALVGSPAAEFPDILRALGLKPAQRDPETDAVVLWRFAGKRPENDKTADRTADKGARRPPRSRRPRQSAPVLAQTNPDAPVAEQAGKESAGQELVGQELAAQPPVSEVPANPQAAPDAPRRPRRRRRGRKPGASQSPPVIQQAASDAMVSEASPAATDIAATPRTDHAARQPKPAGRRPKPSRPPPSADRKPLQADRKQPPPSGPFAILATLFPVTPKPAPEPAAKPPQQRRRRRRKPPSGPREAAS